ncbi:hypothetical protein H257_17198 [Aphanomyces astaci]|uniref:Uncharacterized protein n=1 Tax=Aphanomyces astaci TaxID=112090 RepID=W4FFS4_APHAT|nr:hypothetical protein H257_17198 [Aphanomyces astaci]ETV66295.1 hypothetical protein H257_17198 [Aphanomyces astaci]|eukprot:XP_009844201.1 hypothetical protein H257_17198 [Aphanomyces astaci]
MLEQLDVAHLSEQEPKQSSGAYQSVLSPTFLSRLEETGNLTSPVRQLGDVMELAGFMEVMKRDVDRGVNLRLTFETAEKTMDIPNLKCWVARDSRLGRPGRLIGRHYKTAWAT